MYIVQKGETLYKSFFFFLKVLISEFVFRVFFFFLNSPKEAAILRIFFFCFFSSAEAKLLEKITFIFFQFDEFWEEESDTKFLFLGIMAIPVSLKPVIISCENLKYHQNYSCTIPNKIASKEFFSRGFTKWSGLKTIFFPKKDTIKNKVRLEKKKLSFSPICSDVPDFLPTAWTKGREKPPGPSFEYTCDEALCRQLAALQQNDVPYIDHGVEVMYRFAGFDPFQRSTYFGPRYDLGQFERFRRIFHHSSYRALLGHKEHKILSTFNVNEHVCKQRVWIKGARQGEEETFEFTLAQRVGGNWDGYWLTDSVLHDGNGLSSGIAY